MTTISIDDTGTVITVISTFMVAPDRQQELLTLLSTNADRLLASPGRLHGLQHPC